MLGPGGYIRCVNGFVMLFACDIDQLAAEKISGTDRQHVLGFVARVVPLPFYRLARLLTSCVMSGLARNSFWPRIAHVVGLTFKANNHSLFSLVYRISGVFSEYRVQQN